MKIVAKVRKLMKEGRIEGAKNLIKSNKEIIPLDERKKLKKELMKYLKTKMVAEIFSKEEDVSSSSGEETAKIIESIRDVDDSSSEQEEAPVAAKEYNSQEETLHTCQDDGDVENCKGCLEESERELKEMQDRWNPNGYYNEEDKHTPTHTCMTKGHDFICVACEYEAEEDLQGRPSKCEINDTQPHTCMINADATCIACDLEANDEGERPAKKHKYDADDEK